MFGKLKPQLRYDEIYQIDPELLRARGIRGLFFDIDNTLEPYAAPVPGERLSAWLASLLDAGFSVGILSNAKKNRIAGFVAGFPEAWSGRVLYLYGAAKPLKKGFRQLCAAAGLEPGQAAMVGDQLFTDIWGGNRSGLTTILVKPIDPSLEPPFVRFKRIFERPFL